ncbi:MAG: hypothetical protein ABSB96_05020 [Gaiellaceae bacterium]
MSEYEDDFNLGKRTLEEDFLEGDRDESESEAFGYDEDGLGPDNWDDEV